jgi:hypothetical protein
LCIAVAGDLPSTKYGQRLLLVRDKLDGRSFRDLESLRESRLEEKDHAVGNLREVLRVVHPHAVDKLGLERPDAGLKLQKTAPVRDEVGL